MKGWFLNRWQCFLRSVWGGWPFDYYIDGHAWKDVEYHRNKFVTVSECECCGATEITWSDYPPLGVLPGEYDS